jgi:hypothetical protein
MMRTGNVISLRCFFARLNRETWLHPTERLVLIVIQTQELVKAVFPQHSRFYEL